MENYKQEFNAKDKSKNPDNADLQFKYQDEDLENRYRKFMIEAQKKNPKYQEALQKYNDALEAAKRDAHNHWSYLIVNKNLITPQFYL